VTTLGGISASFRELASLRTLIKSFLQAFAPKKFAELLAVAAHLTSRALLSRVLLRHA